MTKLFIRKEWDHEYGGMHKECEEHMEEREEKHSHEDHDEDGDRCGMMG